MEPVHRSPLRIVAPVLVVAFGVAALIVIATTSGSGGGGGSGATKLEQQGRGAEQKAAARRRRLLAKGTYTVRRNDSFSSISEKTGVPVDRLQQLNPDVDPQGLHAGEKIKLR
ncbi:MAG: LysM peptidoglycan-binding domain-containing protein [Thermoleophilaceae bacterium]|jgi:LysM repeat protein